MIILKVMGWTMVSVAAVVGYGLFILLVQTIMG